jgi:hypothetical protein
MNFFEKGGTRRQNPITGCGFSAIETGCKLHSTGLLHETGPCPSFRKEKDHPLGWPFGVAEAGLKPTTSGF